MANEEVALTECQVKDRVLLVRLKLAKLVDPLAAQRLKAELEEKVNQHQSQIVILDFQEVTFVGSVGFLAFLSLRRLPTVQRVIVCQLDANIREIFTICRLIPVGPNTSSPFEEAATVEAALERSQGFSP
jgi:anti-anti-sigma regulatory factor